MALIKVFTKQILCALNSMKRRNIIHCDLKPENILLVSPESTAIKVIDLGTACYENKIVWTYIQSRYYRAPEVMLGIPYTSAIDMWSLGCVVYELYKGKPLFAGENEVEQMALIIQHRGVPPSHVLMVMLLIRKGADQNTSLIRTPIPNA